MFAGRNRNALVGQLHRTHKRLFVCLLARSSVIESLLGAHYLPLSDTCSLVYYVTIVSLVVGVHYLHLPRESRKPTVESVLISSASS